MLSELSYISDTANPVLKPKYFWSSRKYFILKEEEKREKLNTLVFIFTAIVTKYNWNIKVITAVTVVRRNIETSPRK